jgi:hypothetical protein
VKLTGSKLHCFIPSLSGLLRLAISAIDAKRLKFLVGYSQFAFA